MNRNTSALACDFQFALLAYQQSGCCRELFYLKRFAAMLIAGMN